jgi:hypothetical protein
MMEPICYTRTQNIEAMQMTASNFREIAEWCGLKVQLLRNKDDLFISIQWLADLIGRHDLGDYMTKDSKGFMVVTEAEWLKQDWVEGE